MAYSFVVAFAIAFAIKKTMGIRISPEDEEKGIDAKLHRDAAYELQTAVELAPIGAIRPAPVGASSAWSAAQVEPGVLEKCPRGVQ